MTSHPIDRPAAVHDSKLNTSGGGRTQDPAMVMPLTAAGEPASAFPRGAQRARPLRRELLPRMTPRRGGPPDSRGDIRAGALRRRGS